MKQLSLLTNAGANISSIMLKKILKIAISTLGFLTLLVSIFLSYAYFVEPRQFVVIEDTITVPNWSKDLNGFRIVLIADIHAGSNYAGAERIRYVVEQANAQSPDIIVLLGDYVSELRGSDQRHAVNAETGETELKMPVEEIVNNLVGLKAKYGVFAIIGNHDNKHNGPKIYNEFKRANIIPLENEVFDIVHNGETIHIWGLEDLWKNRKVPTEVFDSLSNKQNTIVLTHNPDSLLKAPTEISVMLSGHTHGGQLNWPIIGPLAVVNDKRFMDGHAIVDGKHVYVSSGVGTSIIPIRFRVPPEINVLTLNSLDN